MPSFDSFSFFENLLPALVVIAPLLMLCRSGALRRLLIAAFGLYLLFEIAPRLALAGLFFWVVVWLLQQAMARVSGHRFETAALWAAVAVTLSPMIIWKLAPVGFVVQLNVLSNTALRKTSVFLTLLDLTKPVIVPLGLSFATFRAVDLLIKSNLGLMKPLTPGRVLAYGLFPSLLVVGPVAQYDEVEATLEGLVRLDRRRLLDGGFRMLSGLAKVFVGAYPLTWSADILVAWRYNSMPRLWLGLIAYGWYFYLNFSGYSDLAIGAGRWLGADIRPNFNRPYLQTSMTDFWNSWHISLSAFMRRNVFIPLGGVRARRQHMAIVVTMMAIALWHDITWSAALFGAYHSAGLLAHRFVEGRRPARSGRGLRVVKAIAVFVYFVLSLPLLSMTVPNAMSLYRALIFGGRLS